MHSGKFLFSCMQRRLFGCHESIGGNSQVGPMLVVLIVMRLAWSNALRACMSEYASNPFSF